MIFVPYSTDAPIYHLPIATGSIILANVAIFFATTFQLMLGNVDEESIVWLITEFDQINPLQWVTGSFMHGDFMHLLGNMFFLWAFGLVVEGKIGSVKFTGLYFLIAAIDGAASQIPMYLISGEGGALGASGVIFALMMIAVIWAPENEMDCFYWVMTFFGTAEVRILTLGGVFLAMQAVFLYFSGFGMSSEMLHMIGAFIGAPIGFFMLRQGMVDCEGWDLVSRSSFLKDIPLFYSPRQRHQQGQHAAEIDNPIAAALALEGSAAAGPAKASAVKATAAKPARPRSTAGNSANATSTGRRTALRKSGPEPPGDVTAHPEFNRLAFVLRQAVGTQSVAAAQQTFLRMDQMQLAIGLSDSGLLRYVGLLMNKQLPIEALRPLQIVAGRDGELADQARLRIALIQLRVLKKPQLSLLTLAQIVDSADAKSEVLEKRNQLISLARQAASA